MSSGNEKQPISHEEWIVFVIGMCSAAGAGVGVVFGQLVFGVAIGLGVGVLIGIINYAILNAK